MPGRSTTGFFLHGSLPPVQAAGLQRFDKIILTSTNKTTVVHGGDGFGQHSHEITITTTVTETTPHGDFPDFAEKLAPRTFTNETIAKQGAYEIWIYGREFTPIL